MMPVDGVAPDPHRWPRNADGVAAATEGRDQALGFTGTCCACWIAAMLLIKALVLAEGIIDFTAWPASVVGAPILF